MMDQDQALKYVFFHIGEKWEEEKLIWVRQLEQEGIFWREYQSADQNREDAVLITDRPVDCGKLVCIALQRECDAFFEGAALVCENLDVLDMNTLRETYMHARGIPVTVAHTQRLILREIGEEDIDELCRISKCSGMEYLMSDGRGAEEFFNRENLEAYCRMVYRFYGYGLWSVWKKDGTLIGCCGLQDMESEEDAACLELQYMLAPEYWKQGYGTEMCGAVLGYAFARTRAEYICVRCHPQNHAARALARKLGFSGEGERMLRKICGNRDEFCKGRLL